uniref:Uncharacterized protein n=1 Tax=Meloidogyne enterolobii TaxID=390850 RepID=A0A6V7ULJ0_MELEN|nr:unnamed protein product [Meloidogyne enterolobii]
MPPSTPSQRRPQQKFNSPNADMIRFSPRSGLMNKLNIDPKNVDCLQLCMDVPFLDHPYLIGPRGRKSQYFMTRYKSLLHFPDTNTRPDGLKLNNVLISGSMKNVEEIRSQIRLRTPIRVIVQIEASNPRQFVSRIEDKINEQSLPIRFNVSDDFTNGVLKTEWRNEELLIEFFNENFNLKQTKKSSQTIC